MNDPARKSPLLAGLAAARANVIPGAIIQATMLLLVLAYYWHPPTKHALDIFAAWKRDSGYPFTFALLGLMGGVLPEVFQVCIFQRGAVHKANFHNAAFAFVVWGVMGCCTDAFYRGQALLFGNEVTAGTIAKKVAFDMCVYTPLWGTPAVVCAYDWKRRASPPISQGFFDPASTGTRSGRRWWPTGACGFRR